MANTRTPWKQLDLFDRLAESRHLVDKAIELLGNETKERNVERHSAGQRKERYRQIPRRMLR